MDLQPENYMHIVLIFAVAGVLYIGIPGAGAFYVRSSWRRFRRALLNAIRFPIADYQSVHSGEEGYLGCHRFFGRLQAFAGDEMVWLTDGKTSIRVDLENIYVYILPPLPTLRQGRYRFPDESPRYVEWSRIGPLPEYTKFFIAGGLFREQTGGYFSHTAECPLTAVIYEGEERDVLPHAIWTGRQRNEYWNVFTPWALAAGSLSLFIYFYLLFRYPSLHFPAVTAATLALLPLLVFVPPGVALYFGYRSLWRKGREFRAIRDLLRIPTTLCAEETSRNDGRHECRLPNGEMCGLERLSTMPREDQLGNDVWHLEVPEVDETEEEYYLFSTYRSSADTLPSPSDIAVRAILIPGNPYRLSARCEKKAFQLESVAVVLFLVGVFSNSIILFSILMYVLR